MLLRESANDPKRTYGLKHRDTNYIEIRNSLFRYFLPTPVSRYEETHLGDIKTDEVKEGILQCRRLSNATP